MRLEAVKYKQFVVLHGGTALEAAAALGRSARTLREWEYRERRDGLRAKARGRKLLRSSPQARNRVVAAMELFGPQTGVPTLRRFFDDMPKAELEDLVRRYRRVFCARNELIVHELQWLLPESVLAVDFTEPPAPVDEKYPAILAARDLAVGEQVLWEGVENMEAVTLLERLDRHFKERGTPLVLKSDNGPAFVSKEVAEFLSARGVLHLLSPPYTPRYNGSVEAGIRHMKDRTTWQAARAGREREWTSSDLEAARSAANTTAIHPGRKTALGLTPKLRDAVHATVKAQEERLQAAFGTKKGTRGKKEEEEMRRESIVHALVAHGILQIRRKLVSLPFRLRSAARIS